MNGETGWNHRTVSPSPFSFRRLREGGGRRGIVNCQGLRKRRFHRQEKKKGEMEGSNYPARDVWEFYCLIITPQRHAKLSPKLLRDTPAGERSSGSGRDRGCERDETREGAHGSDKHFRVRRPGIPKQRGRGKKSTARNQTMHQAAARCRRQVITSLQRGWIDPEWAPCK